MDGLDTCEMRRGRLAQKVGYVYQDFENQIVRPTVLDDASYACLNYALPDYLERGRAALRQCGLEGREDEYVWQLSGGQTHLLALAGAVSLQPDVLILDEPIAQLDPMHADRIYEVLRDLNENHGKTIIVIEHHTEYIADLLQACGASEGRAGPLGAAHADEALQRVEELEESDIFPPQVTQAAHRLAEGRDILPAESPLPTTVAGGETAFAGLRYLPGTPGARRRPAEKAPCPFRTCPSPTARSRVSRSTVFDGMNLNIRQGRKGGPHRLQRRGQVHH